MRFLAQFEYFGHFGAYVLQPILILLVHLVDLIAQALCPLLFNMKRLLLLLQIFL